MRQVCETARARAYVRACGEEGLEVEVTRAGSGGLSERGVERGCAKAHGAPSSISIRARERDEGMMKPEDPRRERAPSEVPHTSSRPE